MDNDNILNFLQRNHPGASQYPQYRMDNTRLFEDTDSKDEGLDVIDSLPNYKKQPLRQRGVGSETVKEETVQCPKCGMSFPSSKHADLLEHIDLCCE